MNTKRKNILAITGYRIFSRMYFYLPILFPLFYLAGESVLRIEILLAAYGMAIVFLIKPVKILTVKIGHKFALLVGEILKIVGLAGLLFFAKHFFAAIALQVIMGLGYAMIVGNDTVILQQTFDRKTSDEYQRVQAKTNSYMFLSLLFSGLLGALLFQYSVNLVFGLSIVAAILSAITIASMKYVKPKNSFDQIRDLNRHFTIVDHAAKTYYFMIRGIALAVFVGILPYFLFVLMKTTMLSFAVIISSFTVAGFISSKYLTKYAKKLDLKLLFVTSLTLVLASLSLLLFQNVNGSFITSFMLGLVSGCIRPVTIAKIRPQYNVEQTLNSAEFNYGVFNSALLLSIGFFLQFFSLNNFIIGLIISAIVYSSLFLFLNQLNKKEYA